MILVHDWQAETARRNKEIDDFLRNKQITVESVFVPFSASRHKANKSPSLNWRVTLKYKGRDVLTTDYMAGSAHCPSYKPGIMTVRDDNAVRLECETGKAVRFPHKYIRPETRDVVYSLLLDSDAIDYDGFESWANNLGYDSDSRKAESVYRACLDIGLKMRAAFGDALLAELREVFTDY